MNRNERLAEMHPDLLCALSSIAMEADREVLLDMYDDHIASPPASIETEYMRGALLERFAEFADEQGLAPEEMRDSESIAAVEDRASVLYEEKRRELLRAATNGALDLQAVAGLEVLVRLGAIKPERFGESVDAALYELRAALCQRVVGA